jgi:epoxyqueuosine reductase QueG
VDTERLKEYLIRKGATLVGVGDVTQALSRELIHLNKGISLAINRGLTRDTNDLLAGLQKSTEEWLKKHGCRSLSIPPDSDRKKDKLIASLYRLVSHKTTATCSGLGWIGKNGLIINKFYGSKLSWATVLTDAPLAMDSPITESQCGDCDLCVKHCPSGAVTGSNWSRENPLQEIVRYDQCRSLKGRRRHFTGKPNCGLCITICPFSRNGLSQTTGNVRKSEQGICQQEPIPF